MKTINEIIKSFENNITIELYDNEFLYKETQETQETQETTNVLLLDCFDEENK